MCMVMTPPQPYVSSIWLSIFPQGSETVLSEDEALRPVADGKAFNKASA